MRVRSTAALTVASAVLAMTSAVAVAAQSAAAPAVDPAAAVAYQENPAHDGSNPDTSFAPTLTKAWSASVSGALGYPLIVAGTVYLDYAEASGSASVEARSLATGKVLWGPITVGTREGYAPLTYDAGRVFALGSTGLLTALDSDSGVVDWQSGMPGQYAFSSPPTAANGTVFVSGAGSGGTLYAVSEADGSVLWSRSVENGDESSPAVDGEGVFVSYACEQAYGFSTTGTALWHHMTACEGGGGDTPVLHGGKVWVRDSYYGPAALDETTGSLVGSFDSSTPPAFDGNTMLTVSAGRLTATDTLTGQRLWRDMAADTKVAPLVANHYVVEAHSDGLINVRTVQSGALVWSGSAEQAAADRGAGLTREMAEGDGAVAVPFGRTLTVFKTVLNQKVTLKGGPVNGAVVPGSATFTFNSSARNAQYVCSVDGANAKPCRSPETVSGLASGRHHFTVSLAYATSGQATRSFVSDVSPPKVHVDPFRRQIVHRENVNVDWSGSDRPAGVGSFEYRQRRGPIDGTLGPWGAPKTGSGNATLKLRRNETTCISVRATDAVGNRSAWTPRQCISRTPKR